MKTTTRTGEAPPECIFIPRTHHRYRTIAFFVIIVCAGLLAGTASAVDIASPGYPVFPADHIWNTRVDNLPLDPNSAAYVTTIGAAKGLHPDFGSGTWDGFPIGIPYVSVPGSQPKVPVTFDYADESDPGPYPIPAGAPIEGDPDGDGDRHMLIVDRDNGILYELYAVHLEQDGWHAGSGAIFDLNGYALRPDGWTSADAAGLAILPGLVRYEEVEAGEITHAIRFTAPQTRKAYLWPARHYASSLTGASYPPMGQRFRLKAEYDITGYSPRVQVILTALKRYGMILADNGASWYLSGAPDERWDNDELVTGLRSVPGSAFEAVDESSLMIRSDSGQARTSGSDTTPPRSITGLANITFKPNHINWSWTDPADPDFNRVMVYLNDTFKANVTKGTRCYNATGLLAGTSYTIGTRTVDASGNLNATWVNRTASTAPVTPIPTPAPTVTGISPSSGTTGTTVNISLTGTGFQTGATVKFQKAGQTDIAASNVAVSGTTAITCRLAIPANTVNGSWDVVVTNTDGQQGRRVSGFTISTVIPSPAPTIASISPSSGKIGTTVGITNLTGKNFRSGAAVKLQKAGQPDINATGVAVPASTRITCTLAIPATAATGSWDVVVTNTDGQLGRMPGGFVITSVSPSPAPVITGISPSTGRRGTTVRISSLTGKYFQPGATVKLQKAGQADISAVSVAVPSSTRITCQIAIPSNAATGSWDVVVTSTDGQQGRRANGFVVRSGTSW